MSTADPDDPMPRRDRVARFSEATLLVAAVPAAALLATRRALASTMPGGNGTIRVMGLSG
jgi:hypothetical protein